MNYLSIGASDYLDVIKKKTQINCEELQYFQEDQLSQDDEEDEEEKTQKIQPTKPGSASSLPHTTYLKTKSNSDQETKSETATKKTEQLQCIREAYSDEESQGRASLNRKVQMLNVHDVKEELAVKSQRHGRKSLDYAADSDREKAKLIKKAHGLQENYELYDKYFDYAEGDKRGKTTFHARRPREEVPSKIEIKDNHFQ